MKAIHLLYLPIFLFFVEPVLGLGYVPEATAPARVIAGADSLLYGIQDRVYRKFVNSMARGEATPIEQLAEQLEAGFQRNKQPLYRYWQAYTLFYASIYWMEQGAEKKAERATDRAISLLKDQSRKTAEDYALLAFLQGFSIPFKAGIRAPFISASAGKNARIALDMDPENPRAYYVLGNNDFYTPSQFGGGKKVVEYLEKAIALCADQADNPYLPTWGGDSAYEMLIRYYHREGETEKWQSTLTRALDTYPDSYRLNELAGALEK